MQQDNTPNTTIPSGNALHSTRSDATTASVASVGAPPERDYIEGEPRDVDILCGNKKRRFTEHPGSRRFTTIIAKYQEQYNQAFSKQDKSDVILSAALEAHETGARFLLKEQASAGGKWYMAPRRSILDKVGNAFRNACPHSSKNRGRHPLQKVRNKEEELSTSTKSALTAEQDDTEGGFQHFVQSTLSPSIPQGPPCWPSPTIMEYNMDEVHRASYAATLLQTEAESDQHQHASEELFTDFVHSWAIDETYEAVVAAPAATASTATLPHREDLDHGDDRPKEFVHSWITEE